MTLYVTVPSKFMGYAATLINRQMREGFADLFRGASLGMLPEELEDL